jgi:hypothetical protein
MILTGVGAVAASQSTAVRIDATYRVSLAGMAIAETNLEINFDQQAYRVVGRGRTRGIADLFARRLLTLIAQGDFGPDGSIQPITHFRDSFRRGDQRLVAIQFRPTFEASASPAYAVSSVRPLPAQLRPTAMDPISPVLALGRRLTGANPSCATGMVVYDGKRLFHVLGQDADIDHLNPISASLYHGPAYRCRFFIRESRASEAQPAETSNLPFTFDVDTSLQEATVELWFTAANDQVPIAFPVRAKVAFFGGLSVQVHRTSLRVSSSVPAEARAPASLATDQTTSRD